MSEESKIPEEISFEEEFDLNIQRKFLGLLVLDKTWAELNGIKIIKPEYFEDTVLYNICKWIHKYYDKYKDIPTKLILKETAKDYVNAKSENLQRFFLYSDALEDIFSIDGGSASLQYYQDKAIAFIRQQTWKQAISKAGKVFSLHNYEVAMNLFKQIMSIGSENDLGLELNKLTADEFLSLVGNTYDTSNMIKTGIASWDAGLGGGFVKDNIHLICAAPGGGKSRMMAYLTRVALENMKKVIFITLELTETETMANIQSAITGMTMYDMLKPENRAEFEEKTAMFQNTFASDCFVKFYKPSTVTADTIQNYIYKVIQFKKEKEGVDWKPDVIFLDYLDKLLPTQKVKGNIYEDIGGVADDCKNLAITFSCPVISGSQLGRISWNLNGDEVISMANISESARKAHLAHSITTINVNPGEKELGKARLFMAKSRNGQPGKTIFIEQNLGKCLMYEVDPWDPKTLQGTTIYTIKGANQQ